MDFYEIAKMFLMSAVKNVRLNKEVLWALFYNLAISKNVEIKDNQNRYIICTVEPSITDTKTQSRRYPYYGGSTVDCTI